jgi:CBS domain-containing protein
MKAADVMTRQVVTVTLDATVEEAARSMLHHASAASL